MKPSLDSVLGNLWKLSEITKNGSETIFNSIEKHDK